MDDMEIAIAIFLGGWLIAASIVSAIWLKREYKPFLKDEEKR